MGNHIQIKKMFMQQTQPADRKLIWFRLQQSKKWIKVACNQCSWNIRSWELWINILLDINMAQTILWFYCYIMLDTLFFNLNQHTWTSTGYVFCFVLLHCIILKLIAPRSGSTKESPCHLFASTQWQIKYMEVAEANPSLSTARGYNLSTVV